MYLQHEPYKVVFLGDGGVGKTALLKRHIENRFEKVYYRTIGAEVHPIRFQTNHGPVTLNIWDTAGQEKYVGLREGYLLGASQAVIFYSADSRLSAKNMAFWESECGPVPSFAVGTKADLGNKVGLNTMLLSVKTANGVAEFWNVLLAKVTGREDIQVVA